LSHACAEFIPTPANIPKLTIAPLRRVNIHPLPAYPYTMPYIYPPRWRRIDPIEALVPRFGVLKVAGEA
jgi:hypothetical protein